LRVGTANPYLIFFGLQESSGAYTSSVHLSSIGCSYTTGIYYKDSKVYGLSDLGVSRILLIYNTNDDSFDGIYKFGANIDFTFISIPVSGK
jgi:hypothetical protein